MGKQKRCERREFIECPYRREEIDYEHWIHKCGKSFEFAKERADMLCKSVPCMFAIELNTQKAQGLKKVLDDFNEMMDAHLDEMGKISGTIGTAYQNNPKQKSGPYGMRSSPIKEIERTIYTADGIVRIRVGGQFDCPNCRNGVSFEIDKEIAPE